MGNQSAEVIIVGAGVMGASTAYHLAARGCTDVLVLEKEETEITGSTARSAAGVRHQFSSAVNVQMSQYSIERLRRFQEEVGGHADLHQVGYLFLLSDEDSWRQYQASVALQRSLGVRTELLTPEDAARLVPGMRTDDLLGATFGPDDGYCDPHGIALGYLNRARELGVRVERAAPVTAIRTAGGRVTGVETPGGALSCGTLVNAAGSWAGAVAALAGLDVPVQPYRRCVYVTEPFPAIPATLPFTVDVGTGFYMRKEHDNLLFGKSNAAEAPGYNLTVDWAWLDTVLEDGLGRFPILERAGLAEKLCWAGAYEITPDHMPILGRHPELAGYVDVSGFSGHGIMHSPAAGMLTAEEVLDGRAHSIDIDELRVTRFREGSLQHEWGII